MLKKIPVEEAVGKPIAHDMTQIIPGESKGARFKKGHKVQAEDIVILKDMGKESIFIYQPEAGELHEEAAALRMVAAIKGENITQTEPHEGKINLKAASRGLLKVDKERLFAANMIDDILITSARSNQAVELDEIIAGVRINPLLIAEKYIEKLESIAEGKPFFNILPYQELTVGLVVTGNEVYHGRIEDKFKPTIEKKCKKWAGNLIKTIYVPDDHQQITAAILELREAGVDIIITGGGMSVDPDDNTPTGIKGTGAEIVSFGAPVLPGNKLMVAYLDQIPILGLPAAVIFHEQTVFDLVFPRTLAGDKISREDIAGLGHGGLLKNKTGSCC